MPRQFFAIDFEHFFWVDLRQYKRVALCTSMIFEMLPTLEKVFSVAFLAFKLKK